MSLPIPSLVHHGRSKEFAGSFLLMKREDRKNANQKIFKRDPLHPFSFIDGWLLQL